MELLLLLLQFLLLFGYVVSDPTSSTMTPTQPTNTSSQCPPNWRLFGDSCYLFVIATTNEPAKTWEDARINCKGYGAHLVIIETKEEYDFIRGYTRPMGRNAFWIGLYRNGTSSASRNGDWVWVDGQTRTFTRWNWGEPNNYKNNENCAEAYAHTGRWSDNNCNDRMLSMCERKKGLPLPTRPTITPIKQVNTTVICDYGWSAFRNSCYKLQRLYRTWRDSKDYCARLGGHLAKIDDAIEQHYLAYTVRYSYTNYWIGLNNLNSANKSVWTWDSDKSRLKDYENWVNEEPSDPQSENCVEMLGGYQSGFWNDRSCTNRKFAICEKNEDENECPDGWAENENICYKIFSKQTHSWENAKKACEDIGSKTTLVTITNQQQQDFINKVTKGTINYIWLALNDKKTENNFVWNDATPLGNYTNWATDNGPTKNQKWKNCVAMLTSNGKWAVDICAAKRNFVCQRDKELFTCKNKINITSTNQFLMKNKNMVSWCKKTEMDSYIEVDFGALNKITRIAVNGSANSFCLKYGASGTGFKPYQPRRRRAIEMCHEINTGPTINGVRYLANLRPFIARYVRIYAQKELNECTSFQFRGCPSSTTVEDGKKYRPWMKMDVIGQNIHYQVNQIYLPWSEARSYCLEQNADLLSMSNDVEWKFMSGNIYRQGLRSYSYWIGLNDRDYQSNYYWSDGRPVGLFSWGSGYPRDTSNKYACVQYRKYQRDWRDADCNERRTFICMKREKTLAQRSFNITHSSTGVWIGGTTYIWPLSMIDQGQLIGTKDAKAYGKIKSITRIERQGLSALTFSGPGSYATVVLDHGKCLTNPGNCSGNGLTLSFLASFDKTTNNWKEPVYFLDSLGQEITKSSGIAVYINNKRIYFAVSNLNSHWLVDIPVPIDALWRHYVMVWDFITLTVYLNGTQVTRGTPITNTASTSDLKKDFDIGIQPSSKVTSATISLSMLAFWERIVPISEIVQIFKTEFGSCPFGWKEFASSCYQFNGIPENWKDAREKCQLSGGDLTTILSPVEQAFMTQHTNITSWIGLQEVQPSVFKWINSDPVLYTNWRSRVRFNYRYSQTCATVRGSGYGTWADYGCTLKSGYICKKDKEVTMKKEKDYSEPITMTICQFSRASLYCPTDTYIRINSAFWGRKSSKVCRRISITDCGLDKSWTDKTLKKLKFQCDGSQSCNIYANSHDNFYGNPCIGVYKYMEITYTCVTDTDYAKKHPCPVGWKRSLNGNACYGLILSKKSWQDAQKTCKDKFAANLVSILGRFEQAMATSLMERSWDTDVWIGLNDLTQEGVYNWSDASRVLWTNWYVGNPRGKDTTKNCVFMNLKRIKKDWMYWRIDDCSKKRIFMCKKQIGTTVIKDKDQGTAKCPVNTFSFRNHCYKFESARLTRNLASEQCGKMGGGVLVTIKDEKENEFIRNKTKNEPVWIGLDKRGLFRGQMWDDQLPVSYTNWDVGEPDGYQGYEGCVIMHQDTGFWRDIDCNQRKSYVCKIPKRYSIFTATPVPKYGPSKLCKPGWVLYNTMCYYISNSTLGYQKSWVEAEEWCVKNGGHLTSVENEQERLFLGYISRNHSSQFSLWIGLHDTKGESSYYWTDKSGYGKYIYWNNGEPNNLFGQEDCVAMVRLTGKWNDDHCAFNKSFICKAQNATVVPTVLPVIPDKQIDRYCPVGWVLHGNSCYKFFTDPTDYKTWSDAKSACEEPESSAVGELASILNEYEQSFITLNVKNLKVALWIGMNNLHTSRVYSWADNNPTRFYYWAAKHPTSFWLPRCVAVTTTTNEAGKWKTFSCVAKASYICKTESAHVSTKVKSVRNPYFKANVSFTCPEGYVAYDHSCYKLFKTLKTFSEARKVCTNDGGDLTSISSQFEQAFLIYLMENSLGAVWIGLQKKYGVPFAFTDGSSSYYSNWASGQPNRHLDETSCVLGNVSGSEMGKWDDVNCLNKNMFICRILKGEPKITSPVEGLCSDGWEKHDAFCYKFFNDSKSWPEARYECKNQNAELVSVEDQREMDFLLFKFFNKPKIWVWTGLNDRNEERSYVWSDERPLTYLNWGRGQPNDPSQKENCVLIDSRTGVWFDWRCSHPYPYICKRSLECSDVIELKSSYIQKGNSIDGFGPEQAIIKAMGTQFSNFAYCMPGKTEQPRLQIDLPAKHKINMITIQGRNDTKEFVKSFELKYYDEYYDQWFGVTDEDGSKLLLFGNNDGVKQVSKKLKNPISALKLAILPKTWQGKNICLKISLRGCKYVCENYLQGSIYDAGPKGKPIVASSEKTGREAFRAVGYEEGWCAQSNTVGEWIQVYFGKPTSVTKIVTFADADGNFVKTYKVQFSSDSRHWFDYKQQGVTRIFKGNTNARHHTIQSLKGAYQSLYIRILPTSWNKNMCMTFKLMGCDEVCTGALLNENVKFKSTDRNSNPTYARLDSGKAWCPADDKQILQIDFGTKVRITKITTQGSPLNYGKARRVGKYRIAYKDDSSSNRWINYEPKTPDKLLGSGELDDGSFLDESTIHKNGIILNHLRIHPVKYSSAGICMRLEVYGCLAGYTVDPLPDESWLYATLHFTDLEWHDDLSEFSSVKFKNTSQLIINAIEEVYKDEKTQFGENALRSVIINQLKEGSVVAVTQLKFDADYAENNDMSSPLSEALKNGLVGGLSVDRDSSFIKVPDGPVHTAVKKDKKSLSGGAIAGLVVAIILVLLFVVLITIYCKRKRDFYGPKQFNNPILYSTADTEGDEFELH